MAFTAGQKLRAVDISLPCTSGTRPSSPHSGQFIYETDTGTVLMYTGSAWVPLASSGTVSHAFQANQTGTGQSINSGADTVVSFDTNNTTTALATKATSGAGHQWTLNRAGIWSFTTTIRWDSAATGSLRLAAIRKGGNHIVSANVHLSHTNVAHHSVSITGVFAANDVIDVVVFQDAGAARTMDPSNTQGWCRIDGVWLCS